MLHPPTCCRASPDVSIQPTGMWRPFRAPAAQRTRYGGGTRASSSGRPPRGTTVAATRWLHRPCTSSTAPRSCCSRGRYCHTAACASGTAGVEPVGLGWRVGQRVDGWQCAQEHCHAWAGTQTVAGCRHCRDRPWGSLTRGSRRAEVDGVGTGRDALQRQPSPC
jgi:hypothetical protein